MITWTNFSMFVSASLIRSRNSYKPILYTSRPDLNCSLRPASHSGEKQNFCLAAIVTATSHMYDAGSLVSAGSRFMRLLPRAEGLHGGDSSKIVTAAYHNQVLCNRVDLLQFGGVPF